MSKLEEYGINEEEIINTEFKQRAKELADRVGVTIHPKTPIELWSLTILENIVTRLEVLEDSLNNA